MKSSSLCLVLVMLIASLVFPSVSAACSSTPTALLSTFSNPVGVAISPDGATAFVIDNGRNLWAVELNISPYTRTLITSSASTGNRAIALSPDGTIAYILDGNNYALWSVPLSTSPHSSSLVTYLTSLANPRGVTISPSGTTAYVADGGGALYSIPLSGKTHVPVLISNQLGAIAGVAINPNGNTLYVLENISDQIYSIPLTGSSHPATSLARLNQSNDVYGLNMYPDGSALYYTDEGNAAVWRVPVTGNTHTPVRVASVSSLLNSGQYGLSTSSVDTAIYVVDGKSSLICVRIPA